MQVAQRSPEVGERAFDIDGMRVCAREWRRDGLPVLAIHGWLDNAASFDRLAPLLPEAHLLALDLPGHGHSDNKPPHATYNLWDDLLTILAVADAMGWERFALLGHSRGAMIATLLAASMPDRVSALLCLDGLLPAPVRIEDTAVQLQNFLHDYRAAPSRAPRSYASLEDVVEARRKVMPMSREAAHAIVERGIQRTDGRFVWHTDYRLKAASAIKLSAEHGDALIAAIRCPALLVLAEQGIGGHAPLSGRFEAYPQLVTRRLPGAHHFHMEEQADDIAALISGFFDEHGFNAEKARRGES